MIENQPTQKRKKKRCSWTTTRSQRAGGRASEEEEGKAVPLICPTIHPLGNLAMMTVSDGNLQNLQIGSTTNNATDPNHEPPSSAENVLSNHIA